MRDLSNLSYHPTSKSVVDAIKQRIHNNNDLFFHILVAYYFCKVASMMRVNIDTHDRGKIPVNMYAINLSASGTGKGFSTSIIEEQVIDSFRERFLQQTFVKASEQNLAKLAIRRANKNNSNPDDEIAGLEKEFNSLGELAFSFDSGTTAAVKQMRHKLLMANAGSMNMEIDEIGSNLLSNVDVLNTFLELFDIGKIKQKLTKNTSENVRNEEIEGRTPTNLMLYGTPSKLLNGGKTEDELMSFIEAGYGRRCFFGYSPSGPTNEQLTAEEIYDMSTNKNTITFLAKLSLKLGQLADPNNFGLDIQMSKDVSLLVIRYKLYCEKLANSYANHEEMRKAEMNHRYFKVLKLAGAYAFIDQSPEITEDHIYYAIKLAEESGKAFTNLLTRDKNYTKLAKYISSVGRELTHVDLVEELPFYKGSEAQKREMMNLAIAWGYKHNIIIKKAYADGIEFLTGESLEETDLNKCIISFSKHFAENYKPHKVKFKDLHKLLLKDGYHWASHHLLDNYRKEDNCIAGFNLVVIDMDDGSTPMETAALLLKDYTYVMHTTKRSTEEHNRYRIILPMTHTLKLDSNDFKEFMNNIYEWLPFRVDEETNQRSRKWMTHPGDYLENKGELLDSLLFIPKTKKNEERKQLLHDQSSLNNIERWFVNNTGSGNRNNMLLRYGMLLVETGLDLPSIQSKVVDLNKKLASPLNENELMSTIMYSVGKTMHSKE